MKSWARLVMCLMPLVLIVSCAQRAGEQGGSTVAGQSAPPSPVAHVIPKGFPIDVGVFPNDGEMSVTGPNWQERARAVIVCGQQVWPTDGVIDHLGVTVRGPEYLEQRELAVFETAEEAVAAVDQLRAAVEGCDSEPNPNSGVDPVRWRLHDAGTGYPGISFSMLSKDDLGGTIGQVTRVGRAALLIAVDGESAPDTVLLVLDELVTRIRNIAEAMCEFTVAGCG